MQVVTNIVLIGSFAFTTSIPAEGPDYASPSSKDIVEKMIDAHGGMERWRRAPTVSFESKLQVSFGERRVPFHERVTVEQGRRRVIAELPNPDGSSGRIAYDGEIAWSAGTLQGIARAPARFTAWRNYFLYNLPWLTQDDGVRIGEPGTGTLPDDETQWITLPMSFADGTGDTPNDTYLLYIEPTTFQLGAAEYGMTYKSMLPEGATSAPRSIFLWSDVVRVDGLVVPSRYRVIWKRDGTEAVAGEVTTWSFEKPFDEGGLVMPPDGQRDTSEPS